MPRLCVPVLLITLSLAGCASSGSDPGGVSWVGQASSPRSAPLEFASDNKVAATGATATTTSASPGVAVATKASTESIGSTAAGVAASPAVAINEDPNDYHIAPFDVLNISIFDVPQLSGTMAVSASGEIDMPLVGTVPVAGKTLYQLKTDLTQLLGNKYLQSPKVTVSVKDAVSQRVTVGGAVGKPGVYQTNGASSLMQVIAMAGGMSPSADERGVLVFRQAQDKRLVAKFDYKSIKAGSSQDPVIRAGDLVMVDESGFKASMRNLRDSLGLFGMFAPIVSLI